MNHIFLRNHLMKRGDLGWRDHKVINIDLSLILKRYLLPILYI